MQTQPILNQQQLKDLIKVIYSPQHIEGIYLVERKGAKSSAYDHYGFTVSGKFLKYFNLPRGKAKVIHKYDTGVVESDYDSLSWQVIHKMQENEIPLAILRTKLSLNDKYNLLFDNCEHFARYVTTGKKESSQVQNVVGLSLIGGFFYLLLKDDN